MPDMNDEFELPPDCRPSAVKGAPTFDATDLIAEYNTALDFAIVQIYRQMSDRYASELLRDPQTVKEQIVVETVKKFADQQRLGMVNAIKANPMARYFFDQDESGHWYMIPVDLRGLWDELSPLDEGWDDPRWQQLEDCRLSGGISSIEFTIAPVSGAR